MNVRYVHDNPGRGRLDVVGLIYGILLSRICVSYAFGVLTTLFFASLLLFPTQVQENIIQQFEEPQDFVGFIIPDTNDESSTVQVVRELKYFESENISPLLVETVNRMRRELSALPFEEISLYHPSEESLLLSCPQETPECLLYTQKELLCQNCYFMCCDSHKVLRMIVDTTISWAKSYSNVTLFFTENTLLGVARHGSLVPWDSTFPVLATLPEFEEVLDNHINETIALIEDEKFENFTLRVFKENHTFYISLVPIDEMYSTVSNALGFATVSVTVLNIDGETNSLVELLEPLEDCWWYTAKFNMCPHETEEFLEGILARQGDDAALDIHNY